MRLAGSNHATALALRRAALLALAFALAFPLATAELRAQGSGVTAGLSAADRKVIAEYVLKIEDFRKLAVARAKLAELAARDRKICAHLWQQDDEELDSSGDLSIAGRVKALEAEPALRAALEAGGLSAREYVVIMLTYVNTVAGQMAELVGVQPDADRVPVNPANRQFLASHHEEVMKLFESVSDPCD